MADTVQAPPGPTGRGGQSAIPDRLSADEEGGLRRRLLRWARAFLGVPEAEFPDLYQGAWRKALDGERRGHRVRNLEYALRWGIHNCWLEECRRRRRRPTAPLAEHSRGSAAQGCAPDPPEQLERLEAARYLFEAVGTMDELPRRVVLLRRVWGLSPAEVCSELGISRRTYRTEHARALTQMYERSAAALGGQACSDRRAMLRAVACGQASAEQACRVDRHVRNCAGCRRLLAAMRRGERGSGADGDGAAAEEGLVGAVAPPPRCDAHGRRSGNRRE